MPVVTVSLQGVLPAGFRVGTRWFCLGTFEGLCFARPAKAAEVERQAWADRGAPPGRRQPSRGRRGTRMGCKPQIAMGTGNRGEDAGQLKRRYLRAGGSPSLWLWQSPAVGVGLGAPRGCCPCPELQGEEPSVGTLPPVIQVTE